MIALHKSHSVYRYLISVAISGLALALIAVLQPVVGFLELLYLLAVAFVGAYVGEGPAVLCIVLCFAGSFWVIGNHQVVDQRLHDVTKLLAFPLVSAGLLYLTRARRLKKKAARRAALRIIHPIGKHSGSGLHLRCLRPRRGRESFCPGALQRPPGRAVGGGNC